MRSLIAAQCCLFCGFALPVAATAQPPRGPRPWWDSSVAKDLNLSDAQTKQIRADPGGFPAAMFDFRAAVNKAEEELQAAFNEDPVDQARPTTRSNAGRGARRADPRGFANGSEAANDSDGAAVAGTPEAAASGPIGPGRRRGRPERTPPTTKSI